MELVNYSHPVFRIRVLRGTCGLTFGNFRIIINVFISFYRVGCEDAILVMV